MQGMRRRGGLGSGGVGLPVGRAVEFAVRSKGVMCGAGGGADHASCAHTFSTQVTTAAENH